MPFQPQGKKKKKKLHIALSKEQLLVFECHMALVGIGTILSLLCSVTDSHVVHRCIMKLDRENPQMLL